MRRRLIRVLALSFIALGDPQAADRTTITVLATTDLHGNLLPFDDYTEKPVQRGLAKLATFIREARSQDPNTLLIDCGDTIQGTPLEYVYQTYVRTAQWPLHIATLAPPPLADPMMRAMNYLGYDAMVVGNHEFNFGLKNFRKARDDARFPWLAANIQAAAAEKPLAPYLLKSVGGVRVGIVGVTTPAVPMWEKPENYQGFRFSGGPDAVARAIRGMNADLVIVAAHSGLGEDPGTRAPGRPQNSRENFVYDLAKNVRGIDAIVFGHSHQETSARYIGDVLLAQPKNWGASIARLDFVMQRERGGAWRAVQKSATLLRPDERTPADPEIVHLAQPYHEIAERYLNTPVADSPREQSGTFGRVKDTALVDAIHAVQLAFSGADVSFASMFNPRIRVAPGGITVRQIAALYLYENELYAIEGDGGMIKSALENSARYFRTCPDPGCSGPLINPRVMGYNFDTAEGVEYEIDLTRPEGDRIRNLRWRGRPLTPDQPLRIAVNSYRAGGSAGYGMFAGAKVLWRSGDDIRELMIRYYTERGRLPAAPDGNWRIVPAAAANELEREAAAAKPF
jgi:2',3'-cyclic-nucleotide 2'-phosphodiesterase/3'-nucleotidase